jgi:putative transposase
LHAWLNRPISDRAIHDATLAAAIGTRFKDGDGTQGARRVWHDALEERLACGPRWIERLMRRKAMRTRQKWRGNPTKWRGNPKDDGDRAGI